MDNKNEVKQIKTITRSTMNCGRHISETENHLYVHVKAAVKDINIYVIIVKSIPMMDLFVNFVTVHLVHLKKYESITATTYNNNNININNNHK